MFKITIEAASLEELKSNLEPIFAMIDRPPKRPTPDDFGYDEPTSTVHYPVETPVADVPMPAKESAPTHYPAVHQESASLPSVPQSTPDADARGIKWDSRIHAASKAFTKDGVWRYKRNVDDATIKAIEQPAVSGAVQIPSVPSVPGFQPVVVPPTNPALPVAAPVSYAAPIETVQAGPARPAHTFESFRGNMIQAFADLASQGLVSQSYIASLCKHFNVANIWDVAQYEDKSRQLFEQFVNLGIITNVG